MSNTTSSLFAGAQNTFTQVEADTGGGGIWPKPGLHACFLDDVQIRTDTQFRMGNDNNLPANSIVFIYTLQDDPERSKPLQFAGEPFDIPIDPSAINHDGHKKRFEISMQRLKGHLTTILGRDDIGDMGAAIDEVKAMCSGDTAVIVNVQVNAREYNGRTYHSEKIKELMAGPKA